MDFDIESTTPMENPERRVPLHFIVPSDRAWRRPGCRHDGDHHQLLRCDTPRRSTGPVTAACAGRAVRLVYRTLLAIVALECYER